MPLTNAQKQKRWRDKRNAAVDKLDDLLTGKPREIADSILFYLGTDQTKKIARALDKRLRNLKPDCPRCRGTGFIRALMFLHCGAPNIDSATGQQMVVTPPCDCEPRPDAV